MNKKDRHQFIVAGVSTAGKSTFSHELVKKYFVQHICVDPIIEAFEDVFPELGITHKAPTHEEHVEVCQKFKPFIFRMIDGMDADNFVIEGFRLPVEDIYNKYPRMQYFVFGFPNTTAEDQLARCREFDVHNWTNEMSDAELMPVLQFLIEESKREQVVCQKLDIPFFDTSNDYWGSINAALELTG